MDLLEKHLKEVINKTWNAANRCETQKDHILNAAIGLASESGEVLDVHKKFFFHKPKERRAELVSEIGDVLFYLTKLMDLHKITVQECLADNRAKIFERYNVKG